jgi:hypothetical protein
MYNYEALFPLGNFGDLCRTCGQLINISKEKEIRNKIVTEEEGECSDRNLELNIITSKF